MSDEDWRRLALRSCELAEAPLFIDDSPEPDDDGDPRQGPPAAGSATTCKLIVIDYLQLMTSGKRVESRQQEVSEFCRAMKLLAKELDVPVVALSQLNRGPEQRTDKKPHAVRPARIGLPAGDHAHLRADTGAEVSIGELCARGETESRCGRWTGGCGGRRPMTQVFPRDESRCSGCGWRRAGRSTPPRTTPSTHSTAGAARRPRGRATALPSPVTCRPRARRGMDYGSFCSPT